MYDISQGRYLGVLQRVSKNPMNTSQRTQGVAQHSQGTLAATVVATIGYKFYIFNSLQMFRSFLKSAKHSQGTIAAAVVPLIGFKFCYLKIVQMLRSVFKSGKH